MALPPTPDGYDNWNQYIAIQGALIAADQGLTYQQGKASAKLLYVSMPSRQDLGTPSYRDYNLFTTWADRQVIPQPNLDPDTDVAPGRPWWIGSPVVPDTLTTETGDTLTTENGDTLIT